MPNPPSKAFGNTDPEGKGALSIPVLVLLSEESVVAADEVDVASADCASEAVFDSFLEVVVDSRSNCRLSRCGFGSGRGSNIISFIRASISTRRGRTAAGPEAKVGVHMRERRRKAENSREAVGRGMGARRRPGRGYVCAILAFGGDCVNVLLPCVLLEQCASFVAIGLDSSSR